MPLRSRVRLLLAECRAVRKGWRLLYIERCACGLWTTPRATIRRNVANSRVTVPDTYSGIRSRTRFVRPGRSGLVREEVSRIFLHFELRIGGAITFAARTNLADLGASVACREGRLRRP